MDVGDKFAFQQTALKFTRTSSTVDIAADATVNLGGAVATILALPSAPGDTPTVELSIPGLNINQSIKLYDADVPIASGPFAGYFLSTSDLDTGLDNLNYTMLGVWSLLEPVNQDIEYGTVYMTGFHTPVSAMPVSGTATYTNTSGVAGFMFVDGQAASSSDRVIFGNGSLTANFASNSFTGAFTNMLVSGTAWNNLNLSGSISGSSLSGSTSALASAGPLAFTSGSTGLVTGGFFGPNADEVGLIWSLQDSVTGSIAVGTFGAVKEP